MQLPFHQLFTKLLISILFFEHCLKLFRSSVRIAMLQYIFDKMK